MQLYQDLKTTDDAKRILSTFRYCGVSSQEDVNLLADLIGNVPISKLEEMMEKDLNLALSMFTKCWSPEQAFRVYFNWLKTTKQVYSKEYVEKLITGYEEELSEERTKTQDLRKKEKSLGSQIAQLDFEIDSLQERIKEKETEINTLKARLFDIYEKK